MVNDGTEKRCTSVPGGISGLVVAYFFSFTRVAVMMDYYYKVTVLLLEYRFWLVYPPLDVLYSS